MSTTPDDPSTPTDTPPSVPAVGDGTSARKSELKAFCAELRTALTKRLDELDGKPIATFEWQRDAVRRGRVEVSLQVVRQGKKTARSWPFWDFCLTTGGGAKVKSKTITLYASSVRDGSGVTTWFHHGEGNPYRQASLVDDSASEENVRLEGNTQRRKLPNPRDGGGPVTEFGQVWCSEAGSHPTDVAINGTIRWSRPELARWWPICALDGNRRAWSQASPVSLSASSDWADVLICFALWSYLIGLLAEQFASDTVYESLMTDRQGWPRPDEFRPGAPRELGATKVDTWLKEQKHPIELPWQVIEAACTSLNSGMHIVLTGPPGCGKTEFAYALARLWAAEHKECLACTASPAWTVGDLIGRYFPRPDGQGLEFRPGFFLQAIERNQWLVIDEFNRAPIDACLGELFTVLSGKSVVLPYLHSREPGGTPRPVRILVGADAAGAGDGTHCDYVVPQTFRLLGTMNDADRSDLSRLSYALLRRVDIVRVDAPSPEVIARIAQDVLGKSMNQAHLASFGYRFVVNDRQQWAKDRLEQILRRYVLPLFATAVGGHNTFNDFVQERVVGVATVMDSIRFLVQGLRCDERDENAKCEVDTPQDIEAAMASYVAMAFVLKVMPQMEGLDDDRYLAGVRRVFDVFTPDGRPVPFSRIVRRADDTLERDAPPPPFRVVRLDQPIDHDVDGTPGLSIAEYLCAEFARQQRTLHLRRDLRDILLACSGVERQTPAT